MKDYQYKSSTETIEKLKIEYNDMIEMNTELYSKNEKLKQLKEEYHKKMLDYRMKYLKEQNKVSKAIEHIEHEIKREGFHHYLNDEDLEKLLDILKEVK
jgi:regulator of replication initiation timing